MRIHPTWRRKPKLNVTLTRILTQGRKKYTTAMEDARNSSFENFRRKLGPKNLIFSASVSTLIYYQKTYALFVFAGGPCVVTHSRTPKIRRQHTFAPWIRFKPCTASGSFWEWWWEHEERMPWTGIKDDNSIVISWNFQRMAKKLNSRSGMIRIQSEITQSGYRVAWSSCAGSSPAKLSVQLLVRWLIDLAVTQQILRRLRVCW